MKIHRLLRDGNNDDASVLDQWTRFLIPFIIYPLVTFSLVASGRTRQIWTGIVIGASGISVIMVLVTWRKTLEQKRRRQTRRTAIDGLLQCNDLEKEESGPLLERVFHLYDSDQSGTMEPSEVRELLHNMYPTLPRHVVQDLLVSLPDAVRLEHFADLVSRATRNEAARRQAETRQAETARVARAATETLDFMSNTSRDIYDPTINVLAKWRLSLRRHLKPNLSGAETQIPTQEQSSMSVSQSSGD